MRPFNIVLLITIMGTSFAAFAGDRTGNGHDPLADKLDRARRALLTRTAKIESLAEVKGINFLSKRADDGSGVVRFYKKNKVTIGRNLRDVPYGFRDSMVPTKAGPSCAGYFDGMIQFNKACLSEFTSLQTERTMFHELLHRVAQQQNDWALNEDEDFISDVTEAIFSLRAFELVLNITKGGHITVQIGGNTVYLYCGATCSFDYWDKSGQDLNFPIKVEFPEGQAAVAVVKTLILETADVGVTIAVSDSVGEGQPCGVKGTADARLPWTGVKLGTVTIDSSPTCKSIGPVYTPMGNKWFMESNWHWSGALRNEGGQDELIGSRG